jgi:hypothetical protein
MNIMVTETSFDPFEWHDPVVEIVTCVLYNGLPYDNIRSLFAIESYTPAAQRYDFIYDNLLNLEVSFENAIASIDFLLTRYEKLRSSKAACDEWPYRSTLLQILIKSWLNSNENDREGKEVKISRALELTEDLFQVEEKGTPLNTIANGREDLVHHWLELLSKNGVDMAQYVAYEQSQHPHGKLEMENPCCRLIQVKFKFGLEDKDEPTIELHNICDPRYEHLDPEYRCEAYFRRENCISRLDAVFIGEDGRQIPPLPGSWTQVLKSNRELNRVNRSGDIDWILVENATFNDWPWEDCNPWWADRVDEEIEDEWSGSESASESGESEEEYGENEED